MIRRVLVAIAAIPLAACQPNPRNEIAAIADAALGEVARTAPGQRLCVARTVAPWRSPKDVWRTDPPPPPGFAPLYAPGTFHGGAALKGDTVAGVAIGRGRACFDLRGPIVVGDRAMLEVHLANTGLNIWLQRADGDWRVITTTTSVYRD